MTTFVSGALSLWPSGVVPTQTQVNDWLNSLKSALDACLVQTSDTGQISMGSPPAWPGGQSTALGYWIYRFNDTRQSTEPLFLKIEPASGGGTTYARRLYITIGTGSDGAGAITGVTQSRFTCGGQISSNSSQPNPMNVQTYACSVDGYFALLTSVGDSHYDTRPSSVFILERSRDPSTYAFDGLGYVFYFSEAGSGNAWYSAKVIRTASPASTGNTTRFFCILPGIPSNSALLNGDKQLYPHWHAWPDVRPAWARFTVRSSEVSAVPTSFVATPIAAGGPRTFMHLGANGGFVLRGDAWTNSGWTIAFLWE